VQMYTSAHNSGQIISHTAMPRKIPYVLFHYVGLDKDVGGQKWESKVLLANNVHSCNATLILCLYLLASSPQKW